MADSILEPKEELAKKPESTIFRRTEDTVKYMGQLMMESESDSESEKNVKTGMWNFCLNVHLIVHVKH